jgi:hypothetical protein
VASAPPSRAAVPSVSSPSPAPVSSSLSATPRARRRRTPPLSPAPTSRPRRFTRPRPGMPARHRAAPPPRACGIRVPRNLRGYRLAGGAGARRRRGPRACYGLTAAADGLGSLPRASGPSP